MGLRDLFRKYKKGRDIPPSSTISDNSKIQQQQQKKKQQDKTGLTCIEKTATV
jgi:hypothetical protein